MKLERKFKIYKEGTTTNGPVTILGDALFNISKKTAFYLYLGYTVLGLD